MRKLIALSSTALLLAACGSQPPAPEQDPAGVESRTPGATTSGVKSGAFDPMSPAALRDPRSPLSKRSIYFDLDSYAIKPEYQSLLETHAKFLKANPSMRILIQGNADERGSREYNLSLGQNRANAVKKAFSLLGVADAQVEAVSLGEEKPACSDPSDACWAQNRRGDILYSGEF